MPNRAGPSSEGKPGFRLLRGRGWGNTARPWETRTLVGLHPWLALAQSPASLPAPPPCMAQKKKETTTQATRYGPETSRVPGFQEACAGGGGGQGMQRVGAQGEGLQEGGEELLLLGLLAKMGVS